RHDGVPRRRIGLSRPLQEFRRRREGTVSARRASGGAHPSGDAPQGALRQPRLHAPPDRRAARRERRRPALSLRAHGEPAVPVPLPLARELDRLLGQSLRPAPRHVGLLAAYAQRKPGYSSGRQTLLTPSPSWPPPSDGGGARGAEGDRRRPFL